MKQKKLNITDKYNKITKMKQLKYITYKTNAKPQ